MELKQPSSDMPELLRELGLNYDPDRLAQVLKSRGGEVRARAIQVTATVGAFLARILKVLPVAHLTIEAGNMASVLLPSCNIAGSHFSSLFMGEKTKGECDPAKSAFQ